MMNSDDADDIARQSLAEHGQATYGIYDEYAAMATHVLSRTCWCSEISDAPCARM